MQAPGPYRRHSINLVSMRALCHCDRDAGRRHAYDKRATYAVKRQAYNGRSSARNARPARPLFIFREIENSLRDILILILFFYATV